MTASEPSGEGALPAERAAHAAAHRRPGVIALWYAYRAVVGLVLAIPVAKAAAGVVSGYPRGDAELFDPGGLMLLELLRTTRRATLPVAFSAGTIALIASVIGLLPFAAVIAALGRRGSVSPRTLAQVAFDRVGTLALLWGAGAAAQIAVAVLLTILGAKLVDAFHLGARGEDLALAALVGLVLLVVIVLGVLRDLASVAAVHGEHGAWVASARALRAMRLAALRVLSAYAWRAIATAVVTALAWRLAPPPERASALLLGAAIHQAAIAAGVFSRASWLAAAIRLLDDTSPPSAPPDDAHDETPPVAPDADAPSDLAPPPSPSPSLDEEPADAPPKGSPERPLQFTQMGFVNANGRAFER